MNEKEYLNVCSRLKTIMMILIIVYHSIALWLPEGWFNQAPAEQNTVFKYTAQWLNMIHIYTFVFVSGYIYSHGRFKLAKYLSFKELIRKKVKRLIVPYILVSLVWCIPMYIFFFRPSIGIVIKNFGLGFSPSQLWFLLMLFFLFIIVYFPSPLLLKFDLRITSLLSFGIYIIYVVLSSCISLPFQILTSIKFMPFFIMGINFDKYIKENNKTYIVYVYLAINIVLFLIYCALPGTSIFFKIGKKTLAYFVSLSGILFAVYFISKVNNKKIWSKKYYLFCENNSFTFYLFHQQIIWIVIYFFNGKIPSICLAILNFGISIIISSILAWGINSCKVLHLIVGK